MCLALVVMGFAVWAASTQTLAVTNTVDFTSIHVLSTVSGTVTGAKAETFANYGPVSTLAGDEEGKLGTWAIGSAMEFADETEPIVITLTIVNNSDERSLSFELSGQAYSAFNGTNLGDTNIDRICVYSINNATPVTNATYTSGAINIEALKTATIVMTLDISDNGKSVTAFNNSFSAILRNVAEVVENFSFNPTNSVLTLNPTESLTEENLPEMVVEGQPAYYGLYEDQSFTQKVQFPYTGETTLYAKFAEIPESLIFTLINDGEAYSVAKNSSDLPTGSLEIPEKYNWKSITTLPINAFFGCTALTNITIPNSVTNIETYAFNGCTALINIVIPNGVTTIGSGAFKNCAGITSVSIPDSVTSIGGSSFDDTAWFTNQSDGLVYAGKMAYKYKGTMPNDTSITLLSDTKGIASLAFVNCTGLISITIPSSVTCIGNSAFEGCTGLTSVTIPNSVLIIGQSAFCFCTGLSSATISNKVTRLEAYTFNRCTALANFTIPESVTYIDSSAFYECAGLTSIIIPNSVTAIRNFVFDGCTGLTSVVISSNMTSIGKYSFNRCTALTSIEIPSSLTSIDEGVFANCFELTSVSVSADNTSYSSEDGVLFNKDKTKIICYPAKKQSENYTIPISVTSIDFSAFQSCTGVANLTIPSSVTTIGQQAFSGCIGLTSFSVSESNEYYSSENGILFNKNKSTLVCYPAGRQDASYIIPSSVMSIGYKAFYKCTNLSSLTIPSSISSVGSTVFDGSTLLKTVIVDSTTIASGLTSNTVFGNLLNNFTSGSELYILDSIGTIGSYVTSTTNFNTPVVVDIGGVNYKKFVKV